MELLRLSIRRRTNQNSTNQNSRGQRRNNDNNDDNDYFNTTSGAIMSSLFVQTRKSNITIMRFSAAKHVGHISNFRSFVKPEAIEDTYGLEWNRSLLALTQEGELLKDRGLLYPPSVKINPQPDSLACHAIGDKAVLVFDHKTIWDYKKYFDILDRFTNSDSYKKAIEKLKKGLMNGQNISDFLEGINGSFRYGVISLGPSGVFLKAEALNNTNFEDFKRNEILRAEPSYFNQNFIAALNQLKEKNIMDIYLHYSSELAKEIFMPIEKEKSGISQKVINSSLTEDSNEPVLLELFKEYDIVVFIGWDYFPLLTPWKEIQSKLQNEGFTIDKLRAHFIVVLYANPYLYYSMARIYRKLEELVAQNRVEEYLEMSFMVPLLGLRDNSQNYIGSNIEPIYNFVRNVLPNPTDLITYQEQEQKINVLTPDIILLGSQNEKESQDEKEKERQDVLSYFLLNLPRIICKLELKGLAGSSDPNVLNDNTKHRLKVETTLLIRELKKEALIQSTNEAHRAIVGFGAGREGEGALKLRK